MERSKEYKKCKDKSPEDTVNRLQNILHGAGVDVTYYWQNNEELECYSNRVQITGTGMGSNGKGTSRIYALASGYAELMERMQNGVSFTSALNPEFMKETDMVTAPDEKFVKADVLAGEGNALMEVFFQANSCKNDLEKLVCLRKWAGNHAVEGKGDDTLLTVPFLSVKKREVELLPSTIYTKMYGTNGMCAGNTPEEALVQGMAEIFERYVNAFLIQNPVTPPTIPDHYLKQYPTLWERIQRIEKDGKYRVIVKDCSLGKGYPVVSTIIINRKSGTFGFRIASHYSFPIALERTLTEALQGRDLEAFTAINQIAPKEACVYKENLANLFKCGVGNFRKELFSATPSYGFTPWEERTLTNGEMLKSMMELFLKEGHDIFVRDVSFMGFPSYHIIVPGISEIYFADEYMLKEANTLRKISAGLTGLHNASEVDVERILRMLRYKNDALFETLLSNIFKRPFNSRVPGGQNQTQLLLAACYYRLGRIEEAGRVMRIIEEKTKAKSEKDHLNYRGIGLLLQLKYEGAADEEIKEVLEKIIGAVVTADILAVWAEPLHIFRNLYPEFKCWDCANCEANSMCDYVKTEAIVRSVRVIYKNSIPDQKELLKTLFHYNVSPC